MFKPNANNDLTRKAIDRVYAHLATLDPASKEFEQACSNAKKLEEILTEKAKRRPSTETMLKVGSYLLMGGLIITAELYGHTITTKAAQYAWPKI